MNRMTPKKIAKRLLHRHFETGSLTWEEAIECALVTLEFYNAPDIEREILEIKKRDVYYPTTNKPSNIVLKQLNLFF